MKSLCKKHKESTQNADIVRNGSVGDREKLICVSSRSGRGEAVARDWEVVEDVKIEA